ncbi:methylmalonyl-CoA mutase [Flavobacteriaceae bacterium TP-CH-4]|uniref:Methylmalonyl-CoA mutase n=1 Tax=Pelagihabitans pacificus TaxID=2696054 RepID=A0A967E882_9FLAO|nr:methylmalonyl-CoA mutase subunit beta [Pelagihabitans pacificus]NHF61395.1 methylmalonyl-CoA mutase [Pelagihabitans pacificus]
MKESTFFKDFDAISAKAWKQKIQYDLKGADYNERLVWESLEGIKVKPFYNHEDQKNGAVDLDTTPRHWSIGETIFVADVDKSNQKALEALRQGAESLVFTIPNETVDPKQLLKGLDLGNVPLHFEFQFLKPSYVQDLLGLVRDSAPEIHLHIDPIGHLAREGNWFIGMEEDFARCKKISDLAPSPYSGSIFSVDASLYQNAGANRVQELAYALCHAHEYLNQNTLSGINNITFKIAIGGNYFFEIAKLQALRLLWKTLAKEYDSDQDCHIMAIPSLRNKTVYAYNSNMLRTTTECLSAILGGADTVCNLAYDGLYHKGNDFGNRIARNQLLLLKHESFLDGSFNPTEGAYYIESLTQQLAQKALELLKQLEASGGFLHQLKSHSIQRKIKESADKEQSRFDQENEILVGTNRYVNPAERMKGELQLYPFVNTKPRKTLIEPIIPKRLAEAMEKERLEKEG